MDDPFPTPSLDRRKLKAAVLFVCSRCKSGELGRIALHKILFLADMLTFAETNAPLTGAIYQKHGFGPAAKELGSVLRELKTEGLLKVTDVRKHGFDFEDFEANGTLAPGVLSNNETALLDDIIAFVCHGIRGALNELHPELSWQGMPNGWTIPYFTALGWQVGEVTDADIAAAVEESKRLRLDERSADAS
jgi:hypothetical protein